MGFLNWIKGEVCRGSNPPCGGGEITRAEWEVMRTTFIERFQRGNGTGGPVTPNPPIKPQPTGGRLIYGDRDPGPVPPRLPDDLADLPSDEQMERWKRAAIAEYLNGGEPTWRTSALLAFAEGQRQAQSLQIPPPGSYHLIRGRCTIYLKGRADELIAILRALGVQR